MMPFCARWAELSDRQMLEEPLREEELRFLKAHERECDLCRHEAGLLHDLRPSAVRAVATDDEVRRILARADAAEGDEALQSGRRVPARGARLLAAAALLSVAAAALLLWTGTGTRLRAPAPAAAPSLMAAPVSTNADSCGALVEGVVVCLAAGSEVSRIELSGPQRGLHLSRGRAVISIATLADGDSFGVFTTAGKVVGSGGVFSVEARRDGTTWARTVAGVAVVHRKGAPAAQMLAAGRVLRLGESADTALSVEQTQREQELLDRWKTTSSRAQP